MTKLKKSFSILAFLALLAGFPHTAKAVSISDYTAFPPFLPRVVSPNILFLLDYSKSMVRPAYGLCTSELSNCQTTFVNLDDYSSTTAYPGYFDIGSTSGVYSDANASKYNCDANGACSKETASDEGEWNGNWLNWMTMTQFDIMKEVFIGGDVNPAPEGQQSGSPTKQSKLTAGFSIYKAVSQSSCSGKAPSCSSNTPQPLPYKWIATPDDATTLSISSLDNAVSAAQALPFAFTFYGTAYSQVYVSTNGYIGFTNAWMTTHTNVDLPNASAPTNIIAPYWDDLNPSLGGTIKTFTMGTSPNRIYVVSYEAIIAFADTGKADPLTFQILLFEGSNHIVFQYKKVTRTSTGGSEPTFTRGLSATVGVENLAGTLAKEYSYNGSTPLTDASALFITPDAQVYQVTPRTNDNTLFQPAPPLAVATGPSRNDFNVKINIQTVAGTCPEGHYNGDKSTCYDHMTTGLFHTFRDAEKNGTLGFRVGFMRIGQNNNDGGDIKNKGKYFNSKDTSNLFTATRSNGPVDKAPLAEALYEAMRYFKQDEPKWSGDYDNFDGDAKPESVCVTTGTSGSSDSDPYCFPSAVQKVPCAKSFALLISSGNYSDDNGRSILNDTEDTTDVSFSPSTDGPITAYWRTTNDSGAEGTRANGGWLDNVAYKARTTDLRDNAELGGDQSLTLYTVNTFSADNSDGAEVLKKASRWGGFQDLKLPGNTAGVYDSGNCSANPKVPDEADIGCDGVPDTYFAASGGSNLKAKIEAAVSEILRNSASGTSVSVLSTSAGGEGALYQAYFYPAKQEGAAEERKWPGFLRAFFLDRYQNLRDDYSGGSADARLVPAQDRFARMGLNTTTNEVYVRLFQDSDGDSQLSSTEDDTYTNTTMDAVVSIWEAGKKLAIRDKSKRKIYLWLDSGDGVVDNGDFSTIGGETMLFDTGNATTLQPYLRASDSTRTIDGVTTSTTAIDEAKNIISFIRGNQVVNSYDQVYRDRCISVSGESTETGCSKSTQRVWPLGDIVYSTPTLVAQPGEKFDLIYGGSNGGSTYRAFTAQYKNRRQVVYVGANDGLLHAFNAGVYHSGDDTSPSAPPGKTETGWFTANPSVMTGSAWALDPPDLGDELWAFLPHDNLPHLAWLACNGTARDPAACGDAEYTHVYYVDHRPKVTDVRIFNNTDPDASTNNYSGGIAGQAGDKVHPKGWGTMLILPMRLGGGAIDVDLSIPSDGNTTGFGEGANDLNSDGDTDDPGEFAFRSAYYALDVTDPEKPPKLLWRFSNSALGFTTSYPGIVRVEESGTVKWYMVVGSGPANSTTSRDYGFNSTTQSGKIFIVDLEDGSVARIFDTGVLNSVMGDPSVVDVNMDFSADVIYIGSAVSTTSGRVFRINTKQRSDPANWELSTLFDPARPLLVSPSVSKDSYGNLWVFFGTGRLRNTADLNNSDLQRYYGIKDKCWKSTASGDGCDVTGGKYVLGDLFDSSLVTVSEPTGSNSDTQVSDANSNVCGTEPSCSYQTLLTKLRTQKGWFIDLYNPADPPPPSERVLSRSVVLGGLLLFTTYKPARDVCSILGNGYLYALYYETGTAYIKPVLPEDGDQDADTTVDRSYGLGLGMPTSVGVAIGETVSGFVQKSTGEIVRIETAPGLGVRSGASSWREKSSGGGTVEIETIYKHIVK